VAVTDLSPAVEAELARLQAENARLRNLLRMTPEQAAPPAPGQAAFFEAPPGMVHNRSPEAAKVAFFGALFAAHRYLRDPVGQPSCRQARLDSGRARRVAQGRPA
jgi:hypothetical protein